MARVLIVEHGSSGHLLVFVRLLAQWAIDAGDTVRVAVPRESMVTAEFRANLGDFPGEVVELRSRTLAELEAAARRHAADTVVLPNAESLLSRLALRGYRGPGRLSALMMRDPLLERPGGVRRHVKLRVKALAASMTSRRTGLDLYTLRPFGYSGEDLHVIDPFIADGDMEDIGERARSLRSELGLSLDTFWFLVTGAVTPRKNLPLILDSLQLLAAARPQQQFGLVIVGPLRTGEGLTAQEIQERAEADGYQAVVQDQLITNFEMNAAVAMADAVILAYSTPNPNSTLIKARAVGTRGVVAGPGPLRSFARAAGFELHCRLDARELSVALNDCLMSPEPSARTDGASADDFCRKLLMKSTPAV